MSTAKTRAPLTVKLIHSAALELIERDGLEGLSMRSLAKALAVNPMAVYHHIPNKASLLGGVFESVLEGLLEELSNPPTWQQRIYHLLSRFRTLATRHPKIFPALIASSHTVTAIQQAVDAMLEAMIEAGLSPKTAVRAGDTLLSFITGFVLLELNNAAQLQTAVSDTSYQPRFLEELQSNQFADSFEFGLHLLIAGIAAHIDAG